MKQKKGTPGYLDHQLKIEILKAIVSFALVLAILFLGIMQTGSRLNLLTIVAILGALPASHVLVGVIVRFPHRSISDEVAKEIQEKAPNILVIYDLIITSSEKVMPVDCIAISEHTVCGYTRSKKVDLVYAASHIKNILSQNGYTKMTVKIFDGYTPFLARAEGMNAIAEVDRTENREREEQIRRLILNISM
ncbi:MAG: hypothetical protein HFH53_04715 [Hespellia sp.]|nr:hypothetical protein [Hespellia sp.]